MKFKQTLSFVRKTTHVLGIVAALKVLQLFLRWIKNVRVLKQMAKNSNSIKYCEELTGSPIAFAVNMMKNVDRSHDYRLDLFKKYSKDFKNDVKTITVCGALLNFAPMLLTVDPILVEHILKTKETQYWRAEFGFEYVSPRGLGTIRHGPDAPEENKLFVYQRKTGSRLVSQKFLRQNITPRAIKYLYKLEEIFPKKSAEYSLKRCIQMYTFEVFADVAFGFECKSEEEKDYYESAYCNMFEELLKAMGNPFWKLPYSKYYVPSKKFFFSERQKIEDLCLRIIDKRLKETEEQRQSRGDLLCLFINAATEKLHLDRKFLSDVVMTFLSAGIDTTAHLLHYIIFYISKDMKLQQALYEDIKTFSSLDTKTGKIDIDLQAMVDCKLLQAVILETGRLHSPAPFNGRVATKDDILPDGTKIPKGAGIFYCMNSMSRDSRNYVDAEEFKPERFLNGEVNLDELSSAVRPFFGIGMRSCLGRHLSIHETKLFVSFMLTKYKLQLSQKELEAAKRGGVLYGVSLFQNYKYDLLVNLEPRLLDM
eukprot:snap_masked-scaffold_33-processed-gene-2.28-mRNA-1 protein AED:1.00 eAED:1.00 QI:0/-1/0/0/-1/1/1/0/536